ncbi:MAG TPA: porin, partial [Planctomycetota bacterium]|nr:porin [Planctomycetota bacterium]
MRRFRSQTLYTLAALTAGIAFLPAADEVPTLEQRLQALDQEVKILKRKGEIAAEEAAAKAVTAKDAPKFTANQKDGFSLSSADGAYKLRIGGTAQIEGVFYLNDEDVPQTNTFFVRRVRPSFEGTVAKYFDYQLVLDFSPASPAAAVNTVLDANVTANIDPALKIKAGRFKVPFGLEFLQADQYTAFIERGLPSQLSPQRDTGVQIGGDVLQGVLNYAVGIFNGPNDRADNNADTVNDDDKEAAARLYATPFKNTNLAALQGLNIGIAATYGYTKGTIASTKPTYLSPGANQFFAYGGATLLHGDRVRFSPQLYYTLGSWDVLAEYITAKQEIRIA